MRISAPVAPPIYCQRCSNPMVPGMVHGISVPWVLFRTPYGLVPNRHGEGVPLDTDRVFTPEDQCARSDPIPRLIIYRKGAASAHSEHTHTKLVRMCTIQITHTLT